MQPPPLSVKGNNDIYALDAEWFSFCCASKWSFGIAKVHIKIKIHTSLIILRSRCSLWQHLILSVQHVWCLQILESLFCNILTSHSSFWPRNDIRMYSKYKCWLSLKWHQSFYLDCRVMATQTLSCTFGTWSLTLSSTSTSRMGEASRMTTHRGRMGRMRTKTQMMLKGALLICVVLCKHSLCEECVVGMKGGCGWGGV